MRNRDDMSGLFFGSLPNLEELVAAKATIQTNKDDEICTIQPMCCRELIFTEPKILVSPFLDDKSQLFLITPKITYESSQFQELLERLEIKSMEQIDLTKSLFQFCFSFTMKQKLAPLWNKAGEFLVQGREFMLENFKLNAVIISCSNLKLHQTLELCFHHCRAVITKSIETAALEVTITDKICIALQACSLKLTPCKPEHFTASTRALDEFKSNSDALISDAAICDDLCYVLPSLKKGRIFSITHQLPEGCPFASYEELRKHWKLMYGYRLPSEENVFYNVHFYYIKGKIFTYPASCIRSSQVLVSPRCDHQEVFSSFLRDLSCRMPAVCATPLALTSSPLYPTSRLQQATHTNHSNLTRTAPPQFSHCRPFAIQRSQDTSRHAASSSSVSKFIFSQASTQIQSPRVDSNTVNQENTTAIASPLFSQSRTPYVPRFTSNRVSRSNDPERTVSGNIVSYSVSGAKIIPVFSRKRGQSHVREPEINKNGGQRGVASKATTSLSTEPRVRNTVLSGSYPVFTLNSFQTAEREKMETAFERNNVRLESTLPEKRTCQTQESNTMGRRINGETIQIISETPFLTLSQGQKSPTTVFSESSFSRHDIPSPRSPRSSTQVSKCLPQTRPGLIITRQAPISHNPSASLAGNVNYVQVGGTASLNIEQRCQQDENHLLLNGTSTNRQPMSLASSKEHVREGNIPNQLFEPFSTLNQPRPNLARKRQITGFPNDDTPPKKPRSKPKLQENVDVRELAIQDQLGKVNCVTLADWLKKRGVAVKIKDKKTELTSKVRQYLALIQHEQ